MDGQAAASIIEVYAAARMTGEMMRAFEATPAEYHTEKLYTAILVGHSKLVTESPEVIDTVLDLLRRFEGEGRTATGAMLAAAMHGCALARRWDDFHQLKEKLYALEGYLNDKAFSALLTHCHASQNWELMIEAYERMSDDNLVLSFFQYDQLMTGCRDHTHARAHTHAHTQTHT